MTVYSGRVVNLGAAANGVPDPTYQWQAGATASGSFTNLIDSATIGGATTASLILSNVTAAGYYRIVTTNVAGSATSTVAALTVLPAPTLSPYANAVYTNGPLAYWRLNESYTETNALDLMSDFMGTYGPAGLWGPDAPGGPVYGPIAPAFPGFETTNTAVNTSGDGTTNTWVTVPTPGLTQNTVTFLAWIYPTLTPADYTGIFMSRTSTEQSGLGFTTAGQLGYTWNGNNQDTWGFNSGLVPPLNQWSMVAAVIEPTLATIYLCTGDTMTNAFNLIAQDVEPWGGATTIGNDTCCGTGRLFNGSIDEVAMFEKALSFDQINSLYDVALGKTLVVAPRFVVQPTSTARYAGLTATLTSLATGSSLSYQWYQGSVALTDGGGISGSKTATLTISGLAATNAGNYKLVVTNPAGSATSTVVTVTVAPRTSSTYEAAVLSLNPLAYWRLNETDNPTNGTAVAFDYVGGYDGDYGTNSLNGFNGIAGPRPTNGFSIFEADNDALEVNSTSPGSWVTGPQPVLNTNTLTFALWVYPLGAQVDWAGLLMNRSTADTGEGFDLGGTVSSTVDSNGELGYVWNDNNADTWSYVSDLNVPTNQWSMVALAIAPTQAVFYLLNTNGVRTATNAIPQLTGTWGGTASIGNDPGFSNARIFNGIIDEVAIFSYTLTPAQVKNLYDGVVSVSVPRPNLTIGPAAGGKLTISWSGPGTLQSTPALQPGGSVWTTVGTNNPTLVTPTGTNEFYRVLVH